MPLLQVIAYNNDTAQPSDADVEAIYNVTYDEGNPAHEKWVGGLATGLGPTYYARTLAGLLAQIGDALPQDGD